MWYGLREVEGVGVGQYFPQAKLKAWWLRGFVGVDGWGWGGGCLGRAYDHIKAFKLSLSNNSLY